MEQIKTRVRKWGNSFGIVLPRELINNKKLEDGSEVIVTVESDKRMTVGDLMKLAKKFKLKRKSKKTQEILDEMDKELWPDE